MPARVQASLKLFRMADNLPPALFAKTSSEQGCRGYSARREVMNFSSGLILIPDLNGEPRHIPMDSSSIATVFVCERTRADAPLLRIPFNRVADVSAANLRWGESKILEKLSAQVEIKICPTRLRGRFDGPSASKVGAQFGVYLGSTSFGLLQFREFRFGQLQNGDVGVCVLPEREEVFVG